MELTIDQALQKAVEAHKAGKLQDAESLYRAILQAQPQHCDANHNLGVMAVSLNKTEAALPLFKIALEANPNQGQFWLSYVDALIKAKQFSNAKNVLVEGKKRGLAGEMVEALEAQLVQLDVKLKGQKSQANKLSKAIELREMGRYQDAQDWLTKFLEAEQTDAEGWSLLSQLFLLDKKDAQAEKALATAILINPNLSSIYRNQARLLLKSSKPTDALLRAQAAYEQSTDDPESWVVLAACLGANQRDLEALTLIEGAIKARPNYAEAFASRAMIRLRVKNTFGAIEDLEKAGALKPHLTQIWELLGSLRYQNNNLSGAIEALKKAQSLEPDNVKHMINLGEFLRQDQRIEEAIVILEQATEKEPENANAWINLGTALQQGNKIESAQVAYKKALAIHPNSAEIYNNLGSIAKDTKDWESARKYFEQAIAIRSDFAEAHYGLGNSLRQLGRLQGAVTSYKNAVTIKPDFAEAHSNLGSTLQELGRLEDAEASYKKALEIYPDSAEISSNLGAIANTTKDWKSALKYFELAIAIKPDYAEAHSNLGNTLKALGRLADAKTSYKKAISIKPDLASALQNYSTLLAYTSNYKDLRKFSDDALIYSKLNFIKPVELYKIWENRLFTWIYHPDLSAEEICDEHKRWGSQYAHLGQAGFVDQNSTLNRRLRIGYVSPDFRGHSCRFYFEPLFASHDHTRFELFAYANVVHEDEHTQRFKSYFDHWHNILGVSDEAAAEQIREDKIDILVDGCGHMMDTRLTVFAHKPAPIQVTWLGAAWTTGLPQMDYVLFDPYMGPEGTAASEQVMRLPRTWCVYRPGERAINASVKTSPAVSNGYITFGYSGRTERLNHRVFHTWGRILKRLPQARLILDFKPFNDPKTQAYYREFLQTHGVDTSRVIMRNSENVFEGHGDIDILLDSFPHSGGTMLFDAVWMSVPVITLASARPVGRVGTSLMTNLGLPEWVAKDEQEYEDKAVAFAQDIPALASLRSGMRARMLASPVMDEKGFAQDMEAAFETMWATWVASSSQ
jgi:protein O-GlcNAc transferase